MQIGDLVRPTIGRPTLRDYIFVVVDKLQFAKYNGGTDKCVRVAVLSEPADPKQINKNYSVGATSPWEEEVFWEALCK